MKKVFAKSLLVAAMFSVAGSALAVQKDITVTANVDAALDMTQTDNTALPGNDSNLLIVFYVQIMPDDFVMQLHRF